MSFSILARQVLMGLIAGSAFGSWAIVRPAPRADSARGSIGSSLAPAMTAAMPSTCADSSRITVVHLVCFRSTRLRPSDHGMTCIREW